MYEPNIKLTQRLQDNLKKIEEVRELIEGIPIIKIVEEPIRHEALVETVYYTALIEGNPLDIRDAERLGRSQLSGEQVRLFGMDEQELLNIYKAMSFIRGLADMSSVPIDEQVIKQIHAFLVRDIPSQGLPGVYKSKPNQIIDKATMQPIYLPPSPNDTPRLMSEFNTWLCQSPMAVHPMIFAGIAHLELVAIHPFDNGNGRTARALADLILYRNGYKCRYLFSWVRQLGIDMATYHQKLRQVLGPAYGTNVDPTAWLEYFAESVAESLLRKKPILLRIHKSFVNAYNRWEQKGLSKDQVEAIVYATIEGGVNTGVYMDATGLSRSTVVKRLNALVEAGIMRIEGKGRSVRYVLEPEALLSSKEQMPEGVQLPLKTEA